MAGIARDINFNLEGQCYFTVHSDSRSLCVQKQTRVYQKRAGIQVKNETQLNTYI
jgi:hypothetical protein